MVRLTGFEFTDHFLNCLFLLAPCDVVSVALAQNHGFQLLWRTSNCKRKKRWAKMLTALDMYDLAPFVSEAFDYILPFFAKNL